MKNYRLLVPIVLIALFFASFYMLYDAKASKIAQYNEFLESARHNREIDIQVDAEEYYKKALDINPSVELYVEMGEFYRETGQVKKALNWGSTMVTKYPKEAKAYEFQMGLLAESENYIECFRLYNKFVKRDISSKKVSEYIAEIEYKFYFKGEYLDVGVYSGGLCPVLIGDRWGYVDTNGQKRTAGKFVKAGPYSGELAPVIDENGNAFYIDPNGNKKFVVLEVDDVTELGLIENGIYSLFNGSTWGFYDQNYKHLFGKYDEVSSIGNGIAAVRKDDKWTLVDREGKDLTGKKYSAVVMDEKLVVYRNDRLFVDDGSGYKMIDSSGKAYGKKSYEDARIFNDSTYAAVKLDGKWGFVDAEGKMVIKAQYEDARSFSNGYAAVKKDGLWGFIDTEGKMVIEPQFENAKDFNDHGAVFVMRQFTWELLCLYKHNY